MKKIGHFIMVIAELNGIGMISALASAQGLITHTTLRRFCQPVYETNYVLPCETHMMMMMMGPDVFLERIIRPFLNQSS